MSDMPKTKGVGMKRRALALVLAAALTLGAAPTAMYAADEPEATTPSQGDETEQPNGGDGTGGGTEGSGADDTGQTEPGDNPSDEATAENAVAKVTPTSGEATYVESFDEAISAVAEDGGTIELLEDVNMTKQALIKSRVIIVGNNHTITGVANDPNVNFKVDAGTLAIGYVTLDGFGMNAGTDSGLAVIKVESGKTNAIVETTNVDIKNFCRSAYDIRSGSLTIKGGVINCGLTEGEGTGQRLSKAIQVGLGSSKVTGTISNVTIQNSTSDFENWDCGGIEIYQNAEVTINNCAISGVENGISVDNYYAASGEGATGAFVRVNNSLIQASDNAVRIYGPDNATGGKSTTVTVNGGTLTGDIAIANATTDNNKQETISVENAKVTGSVDNDGGSMAFVNSTVTLDSPEATTPTEGITYINTTVNGTQQDTATTAEAILNGATYADLEEAVKAAKSGDVITLLNNAVVDGASKVNSEGILTFDNVQNVTIEGNGKTISAENVDANTPSMINVVNNASVTIKNLTIDGAINGTQKVKHGVNVWNKADLTVDRCTIKNCTGYAIVANSSSLMVNGLTTSNNVWGGINVDNSPNGSVEGTTITIKDARINETNSIKIEHSKGGDDSSVVIDGGSFKNIVNGIDNAPKLKLTITGGTFKPTEGVTNAIDINDYVAAGLEWNPSTGEVQKKAPDTPDTPDTPVTPSKPSYAVNVTKPENGSIAAKPAKAKEGDKVTITVTPDKGFELVELTVTDKDGKAVKATLNDDGTYTFTMPKGAVSIAATFDCDGGELCPTHPFTDVDQDKWYHDAVDWAVENGVMRGYDNTTLFGPEDSHTREQAATVMWNIMGEGDLEAPAAGLADVIQTEWYAPYVNWAYEAGIMRGYTGTDDFGVGDALSREQFAQIIVNATKADLSSVDTSVLDDFEDPDSVSPWAEKTMAWAVENGIIHGVDDTKLQGDRSITRAEMATMVKNAVDEGIISLAE